MRGTASRFLILIGCLLALALSSQLFAQESRGTIVGKVTDASGAVVPGAAVEVTNKTMGTKLALVTNAEGFYQAPYLIPGQYQVTVEKQGFKKHIRDVQVRVNDRLAIDVVLEVGAPDQAVTVTAEATPLLNTTTASIGQVVDARRISELPTPHGDPYALIGLSAGVSWSHTAATLNRPFEPTHIVGYAFDGTRANRSDVKIDGLPSTATANANEVIASYVPPADLVAEFKVQTAAFDASSGNSEGGVTNISIKAGTNQLHGTAYWANMASGLAANEWFSNANKQARAVWDYNRWGGVAGGPVYLPKLYDGRNKTWFMYGYEAIHETRPRNNNGSPSVPTKAMKSGDFSALLAVGSQYQIYNPYTRVSAAGGRYQQQPFTNNIIPATLHNPITKKVLDTYYPEPVATGDAAGQNNMLEPNLPEAITYFTHTIRIDHALTTRQKIFGRTSWYDRDSNYNNYLHSIASGEWFLFKSRQGVLDYVYILNPTTTVNARYGYNRFIRGTNSNPANRGLDLTTLGFSKAYNDQISPEIRRFPRFAITSYTGTAVGGELRPCDTHSFAFTLEKMWGAHALKSGLEFRSYRENDVFFGNDQTGTLNFDATWTRGPLDNSATAPGSVGQSMAAFLLGLPSTGSVAKSASYAEQSTNWGIFVQDDWTVNNRLTLNLGLRWEYEGALTERFDRSVRGFDYSYTQPIEAAAKAAYALNPIAEVPAAQFNVRGGLLFANVAGQPRGLYSTPKANLLPRLGIAYKLTESGKTVLRAGYGIFYGFLGQRRGDVQQTGFSQTTTFVPTQDNGLTWLTKMDNPFPSGLAKAVGSALAQQTSLGQAVTFFNSDPDIPYMQRWQFGIQHEFGGFVADATYVGNRGTHIEISRNLNATPLQYLSTSKTRDQDKINYLSANIKNPFFGLSFPAGAITALTGTNIARERLLRPFPGFDSVNTTTNQGYSWYHSLQLGIQKRFSKGYTVMTNYTFSKFMSADTYLNAADPMPTKMISDQDTPHRLSVSWIYELPFGAGHAWGGGNPVLSRIVGGWQIQGIAVYQSARPINGWGNIIFTGDVKNIALPTNQQAVERWFNTDAGFNKVSAQALGSNVRTFPSRFGWLRTDAVTNVDLSILKKTKITESKEIHFRAEAVNAFNHANFAQPNLDPTSASFGRVTGTFNSSRRIQLGLKFVF